MQKLFTLLVVFIIIISISCPVHPVSCILILRGYCRKVDPSMVGVKCSSCVPNSSLMRPPHMQRYILIALYSGMVCVSPIEKN